MKKSKRKISYSFSQEPLDFLQQVEETLVDKVLTKFPHVGKMFNILCLFVQFNNCATLILFELI